MAISATRLLVGLGLALAACAAPPPAPLAEARRCDGRIRVVNASPLTVEQLYVSHAAQGGWGVDRLGQGVLRPGAATELPAPEAGAQDARVVWADGRAMELRRTDLCAAGTLRIGQSGLSAP
ncbi:hypothetical protein JMJ55_12995 [Belnapia sp. T6]|uniref:Lipoprotein n=1 Tax=Belnapia mucosa TaxID=2804532 RepID=A0ABS1V693_9PROT|nr:hypothetical protein [Belnapia mucosa]MBL6456244.1 hypothetical protein [Belnapia mucosa]